MMKMTVLVLMSFFVSPQLYGQSLAVVAKQQRDKLCKAGQAQFCDKDHKPDPDAVSKGSLGSKDRISAESQKPGAWTNDDFLYPGDVGPSTSVVAPQSPTGALDEFRNLSSEELGAAVLKMAEADVNFPGRGNWEQRLFDAKQAMVDQAERLEGHKDANLDVQRQEIQNSQDATTKFKAIAGEGIQKAKAESDPKLKAHLQYEEWASQCSQYSSSVQTVGPNAGVNASEECYAGLTNFKAQMQQEGTW